MSEAHEPAPCTELRTKKWFFLDAPASRADQLFDASNHCWCAHTSTGLGPDGELVDRDECAPGRGCYRAPADLRLRT